MAMECCQTSIIIPEDNGSFLHDVIRSDGLSKRILLLPLKTYSLVKGYGKESEGAGVTSSHWSLLL